MPRTKKSSINVTDTANITVTNTNNSPVGVTLTEQLARYMAGLGFETVDPKNRGTLEYTKWYSNLDGKVAKVTAIIDKDKIGLDPIRPSCFFVTSQYTIKPSFVEQAPVFARTDLERINSYFINLTDKHDETQECSMCGQRTDNYAVEDTEITCDDCIKQFANLSR